MLLLLRSLFCYMKPMLLLFRSTFFYMKPIVLRGLNCTHPNYKSCSFQLQGMLLTRLFFTASLFALSIYSQFKGGWREEKNCAKENVSNPHPAQRTLPAPCEGVESQLLVLHPSKIPNTDSSPLATPPNISCTSCFLCNG